MDEASMIRVVWSFRVSAKDQAEFERVYGPEGEWAQLFRKGPGFRGTRLVPDVHEAGRYLTHDEWDSAEAYERFRTDHEQEYAALDRRCERLTRSERLVGLVQLTARP